MESSNADAEVSNSSPNVDKTVLSPIPDLVTDVCVPASANTSANVTVPEMPPPSHLPPADKPSSTVTPSQLNSGSPRATSLPSAASEASVKNRGSREEKSRKKEDKSVDHVLRALNSLNTTEEKLAAMCKKYADIFDEHRKLQLLHKQNEKKCGLLQREKEQLQAEQSKAILTRSRLENLCRELQRQNKAIKDESLLKIREEEEKRKEVSAKFQTTMNEITTLMQQNNDKNMKLRDDNIDMTSKLKNICEQYELRQQQVERISKQMQLEQQLADAKLAKLKMEMAAEREVLLQEKQQLLLELQQYQQRCTEFQATEVNLRNQISMYNDKYEEFQKALGRSNEVFGGFKGEMEKMSKKICKLEKETSSWKQRWERSHNALLEMAADKQKSEQELSTVSRQLVTLQGLCRTLQTERATLMAKLKTFTASGHEPLEKGALNTSAEKCIKPYGQSIIHNNPSANHVVESDPVLDLYTQDILASFKESVATEDTASGTTENAVTLCVETSKPMPASPLPDIVGASNNCVVDQKPEVNSALCQWLENTSLEQSKESSSVDEIKSNVPVLEDNVCVGTMENQLSVIVENSTAQVVLNGDAHVNDTPSLQPQPPKSPTAKSGECEKKTKESAKKKKK